jgi:hypothetical protein
MTGDDHELIDALRTGDEAALARSVTFWASLVEAFRGWEKKAVTVRPPPTLSDRR